MRAKRHTLRDQARAKHFSRPLFPVRAKRRTLAPQRAPHSPAACPEPKTSEKSWMTRSRSAIEARRLGPRELTDQARAISKHSAGGQASPDAARPRTSQSSQPPHRSPIEILRVRGQDCDHVSQHSTAIQFCAARYRRRDPSGFPAVRAQGERRGEAVAEQSGGVRPRCGGDRGSHAAAGRELGDQRAAP